MENKKPLNAERMYVLATDNGGWDVNIGEYNFAFTTVAAFKALIDQYINDPRVFTTEEED